MLAPNVATNASSLDTIMELALSCLDSRTAPIGLIQVPLHLRGLQLPLSICRVGRGFTALFVIILVKPQALFRLIPRSPLE